MAQPTQLDRIEGMLQQLLQAKKEEPAPASTTPHLIGPGHVELPAAPGVVVHVVEPIAVDWQPGLAGGVLGGQGKSISEPSNAPAGYARRSPRGYPYQYALGTGGKPVGDPRIAFGDQTFGSDAEIAANVEAAAQRRANIEAYMDRLNSTPIDGLSGTTARELMQDPAGLALIRHLQENAAHRLQAAGKPIGYVDLFRKLLDGSHTDMNRAIEASYKDDSQAIQRTWAADESQLRQYQASSPWKDVIESYNKWISEATR